MIPPEYYHSFGAFPSSRTYTTAVSAPPPPLLAASSSSQQQQQQQRYPSVASAWGNTATAGSSLPSSSPPRFGYPPSSAMSSHSPTAQPFLQAQHNPARLHSHYPNESTPSGFGSSAYPQPPYPSAYGGDVLHNNHRAAALASTTTAIETPFPKPNLHSMKQPSSSSAAVDGILNAAVVRALLGSNSSNQQQPQSPYAAAATSRQPSSSSPSSPKRMVSSYPPPAQQQPQAAHPRSNASPNRNYPVATIHPTHHATVAAPTALSARGFLNHHERRNADEDDVAGEEEDQAAINQRHRLALLTATDLWNRPPTHSGSSQPPMMMAHLQQPPPVSRTNVFTDCSRGGGASPSVVEWLEYQPPHPSPSTTNAAAAAASARAPLLSYRPPSSSSTATTAAPPASESQPLSDGAQAAASSRKPLLPPSPSRSHSNPQLPPVASLIEKQQHQQVAVAAEFLEVPTFWDDDDDNDDGLGEGKPTPVAAGGNGHEMFPSPVVPTPTPPPPPPMQGVRHRPEDSPPPTRTFTGRESEHLVASRSASVQQQQQDLQSSSPPQQKDMRPQRLLTLSSSSSSSPSPFLPPSHLRINDELAQLLNLNSELYDEVFQTQGKLAAVRLLMNLRAVMTFEESARQSLLHNEHRQFAALRLSEREDAGRETLARRERISFEAIRDAIHASARRLLAQRLVCVDVDIAEAASRRRIATKQALELEVLIGAWDVLQRRIGPHLQLLRAQQDHRERLRAAAENERRLLLAEYVERTEELARHQLVTAQVLIPFVQRLASIEALTQQAPPPPPHAGGSPLLPSPWAKQPGGGGRVPFGAVQIVPGSWLRAPCVEHHSLSSVLQEAMQLVLGEYHPSSDHLLDAAYLPPSQQHPVRDASSWTANFLPQPHHHHHPQQLSHRPSSSWAPAPRSDGGISSMVSSVTNFDDLQTSFPHTQRYTSNHEMLPTTSAPPSFLPVLQPWQMPTVAIDVPAVVWCAPTRLRTMRYAAGNTTVAEALELDTVSDEDYDEDDCQSQSTVAGGDFDIRFSRPSFPPRPSPRSLPWTEHPATSSVEGASTVNGGYMIAHLTVGDYFSLWRPLLRLLHAERLHRLQLMYHALAVPSAQTEGGFVIVQKKGNPAQRSSSSQGLEASVIERLLLWHAQVVQSQCFADERLRLAQQFSFERGWWTTLEQRARVAYKAFFDAWILRLRFMEKVTQQEDTEWGLKVHARGRQGGEGVGFLPHSVLLNSPLMNGASLPPTANTATEQQQQQQYQPSTLHVQPPLALILQHQQQQQQQLQRQHSALQPLPQSYLVEAVPPAHATPQPYTTTAASSYVQQPPPPPSPQLPHVAFDLRSHSLLSSGAAPTSPTPTPAAAAPLTGSPFLSAAIRAANASSSSQQVPPASSLTSGGASLGSPFVGPNAPPLSASEAAIAQQQQQQHPWAAVNNISFGPMLTSDTGDALPGGNLSLAEHHRRPPLPLQYTLRPDASTASSSEPLPTAYSYHQPAFFAQTPVRAGETNNNNNNNNMNNAVARSGPVHDHPDDATVYRSARLLRDPPVVAEIFAAADVQSSGLVKLPHVAAALRVRSICYDLPLIASCFQRAKMLQQRMNGGESTGGSRVHVGSDPAASRSSAVLAGGTLDMEGFSLMYQLLLNEMKK